MNSMENKTGSRISEADGESHKSSEPLLKDLNVEELVCKCRFERDNTIVVEKDQHRVSTTYQIFQRRSYRY